MKRQRFRIQFSKTEAMRFTGHLDLILTWERTFRRAGLPLSYSEGYNPRPVINLASPLPLGFVSSAELGDFWLSSLLPRKDVETSLLTALPPGLSIISIVEVEELHGAKLPSQVVSATYTAELDKTDPGLPSKIDGLMASETHTRVKRGKEYDLRPLILDITLFENSSQKQILQVSLVTKPNLTGRPDEVLLALDILPSRALITRTAINLKTGGSS